MKKINVHQWIEENKEQFTPPVCNKLMHNEQLTIMFVGGPNVRKDYHFEEGEELFYQLKGDMCLKIIEKNQHRDIIIKEGQMFLLPGRVPHSPNRFENTVGFVMERKRDDDEMDCLRYYQENSTDRLFERWFHTTNLGIQLVPVIKEFFASEECRTGRPKADSFPKKPLQYDDENAAISDPFYFQEWIRTRKNELLQGQIISIFPERFQTRVLAIGKGKHPIDCSDGDVWLWQQNGQSIVEVEKADENQSIRYDLNSSDSIYIQVQSKCQIDVSDDGLLLAISQNPKRKSF